MEKKKNSQTLNGRGDYLPITPMKSKDIDPNYLSKQALPNPDKLYAPETSPSASAHYDETYSLQKKEKGNVWSSIINIIGSLATAGSNILGTNRSMANQRAREPKNNTALFTYMHNMTKQQPTKTGLMNPNAVKFVLLLGVGSFFVVEMLHGKEDEADIEEKKLVSKKKKLP